MEIDARARLEVALRAMRVSGAAAAEGETDLAAGDVARDPRRGRGDGLQGRAAVVGIAGDDLEVNRADRESVVHAGGDDAVDVDGRLLAGLGDPGSGGGEDGTGHRTGVDIEIVIVELIAPGDLEADAPAGVIARRERQGEGVAVAALGAGGLALGGRRDGAKALPGGGRAA